MHEVGCSVNGIDHPKAFGIDDGFLLALFLAEETVFFKTSLYSIDDGVLSISVKFCHGIISVFVFE